VLAKRLLATKGHHSATPKIRNDYVYDERKSVLDDVFIIIIVERGL
jgi:hypothetical protein